MDIETAKAMQAAVRMIDNVNDRSMLNGLSLNLSLIVAVALRRQGLLSSVEIATVEQSFDNAKADWPEGKASKALETLNAARRLWDAGEPS